MSHQSKTTRILLVSFVILALLGVGVGLDNFQVFAQADTCSDGGNWHKIEAPGPYTYTAGSGEIIDAVCIKGGSDGNSSNGYIKTFTANGSYQVGDPLKTCVSASGIGNNTASASQGDAPGSLCAGISHVSFRVTEDDKQEPTDEPTLEPTDEPTQEPTDEPTQEPTDEPTQEPTEEPKGGNLTILGVCEVDKVVWTITNENDTEISFTWLANNGQSGQGSVPALSSIKVNTNLAASSVTISYTLNNTPAEIQGNVDVCSEEPKSTPTEPPKESTPTPDPTDSATSTESNESKPQVDPKPDLAAGGSGPSLGSLITVLVVSGAGMGFVPYLVKKAKKGEIFN